MVARSLPNNINAQTISPPGERGKFITGGLPPGTLEQKSELGKPTAFPADPLDEIRMGKTQCSAGKYLLFSSQATDGFRLCRQDTCKKLDGNEQNQQRIF